MRLKVRCELDSDGNIPYNYNYEFQNIIYKLIENSSPEFSDFLHNVGFVEETRTFKLFTFSKLFFADYIPATNGFEGVKSFEFLFSTPIQKSYEHLVLGIFSGQQFTLHFSKSHSVRVNIVSVESLPEPGFCSEMKFIALSPIVASVVEEREGRRVQHFLDYIVPAERDRYVLNIRQNLVRKYKAVRQQEYSGSAGFEFSFDIEYILKRKGNIRKNIKFKKDYQTGNYSRIIGMEAPFTIKADPELIKIGYQCGFGEKNSAGFGMVEVAK